MLLLPDPNTNVTITIFFSHTVFSPALFFFFFNDPAPPETYPLPLHDALPIFPPQPHCRAARGGRPAGPQDRPGLLPLCRRPRRAACRACRAAGADAATGLGVRTRGPAQRDLPVAQEPGRAH